MSKWFVKYRYSDQARLRIFCFPYAGGSASAFTGWQDYFDDNIDLFAIQAPGRETRFKENPIEDLPIKVDLLFKEIHPFVNIPYIFVGHSNGALIAFELARKLQKNKNFYLKHIFLSAKRAPHLPELKPPSYNLPYDDFIEELKTFSTIPSEIINDPKMMEVFIPMLRADFGLGAKHVFDQKQKLGTGATLFWGQEDADAPKEDVIAWQKHIVGNVNSIGFNGGHFFIHDEKEKFISEIRNVVTAVINSEKMEII
ncbi:MAG: thioesterase [Emcibacteraceae bacterium]|nr:thioesterase [Emcibacteraceae bacterium]